MSSGSSDYARALFAGGATVREEAGLFDDSPELEIKARWFAGDLGREWTTEDGRRVEIVDFGRWNREPGPDFADVRLRFDGGDALAGAVEIDRDVRDWERHGHATNPAFRETILHFFLRRPAARVFTRTCDHVEVPQARLILGNEARHPAFADPEGLPITSDPKRAREILLAAARHRLCTKSAALRRQMDARGRDEAVFSALAVTLGYKRNQTPFLLLAQRAGLSTARSAEGEAVLFGLAGFLEAPEPPAAGGELRAYLRDLWEDWWRVRAANVRGILHPKEWTLAPVRPANHPHRRVAALAQIAVAWPRIRAAIDGAREDFLAALDSLTHPFWEHRFNLDAGRLEKPQALVGTQRATDMLINVWHPLAADRGLKAWQAYTSERGPAPAAVMRRTAQRFFGGAADGLLGLAAVQQGLLQIERDDCAAEDPQAFRERLRRLRSTDPDSTACESSA